MATKIFIISIILFLFASLAFAAPAPRVVAVNEASSECTVFHMGDEWAFCRIPDGWESVGFSHDTGCPLGYTELEANSVLAVCYGSEDVIIHRVEKKCGFLENPADCENMPAGWSKSTEEISPLGFLSDACPDSFEWGNEVFVCQKAGEAGNQGDGGSLKLLEENWAYAVLAAIVVIALAIALRKMKFGKKA